MTYHVRDYGLCPLVQPRGIVLAPCLVIVDEDLGAICQFIGETDAGQSELFAKRIAQLLNEHGLAELEEADPAR